MTRARLWGTSASLIVSLDADAVPEPGAVERIVKTARRTRHLACCGSNTLMRRAAVESVGGFDETLEAAEDWELHTRLAARYAFAGVPEVVVLYRRSRHSLISQFWLMERNFLIASRKVFAAAPLEARPLEVEAKAAFYRYPLVRTVPSRSTGGKMASPSALSGQAAWRVVAR